MSTKYTPAPWLVEGTTVYALEHYGWKKGEEQFCNRFTISVQRGQSNADGELEANARLIAAAPELLEVSMEVRKIMKSGQHQASANFSPTRFYEALAKMDDAIAKALGGQA